MHTYLQAILWDEPIFGFWKVQVLGFSGHMKNYIDSSWQWK